MLKKEGFREISEQKVLSSVMDVNELTRLQSRFAPVSNLFVFAMSGQGNQLTEMTGPKEQGERLRKCLGTEAIFSAYHRVADNGLEDMVIEDTQFDNVKLGAIAIRSNGKMLLCWIMIAVLKEVKESGRNPGILEGISVKTTYSELLKSMDLLQYIATQMIQSQSMVAVAEAENEKIRFAEDKMKKTASRAELTTKVVQLLERTDAIEKVFEDLLHLICDYMDLQSAHVLRLEGMRKMDVICECYQKGVIPYFEKTKGIDRLSILRGEKTSAVSYDSSLSLEDKTSMDICGATAFICAPIIVQKTPDLYALFVSHKDKMVWSSEDIRLVNDAIKIVQSIMIRKIQKNSLAVSYTSLEAILDNVGSAVFVRDTARDKVLFINELTKKTFAKELEEGRLMEIMERPSVEDDSLQKQSGFYEIYEQDKNKWYEVNQTQITWVDGSAVELYSVYDITEKKEYQKHIEKQAFTDFLTGLNNRLCCERDLSIFLDQATKQTYEGAVIYIDLDDFKTVNDTLGHESGDVLLKSVASGFKSVKGIEETCYRMGGDEFIIIIPDEFFCEKERIVGELQDIFKKPFHLKNQEYYCTMSMGMVYFPMFGQDMQELVQKADIAMYKAKKSGKNQIAIYEDGDE